MSFSVIRILLLYVGNNLMLEFDANTTFSNAACKVHQANVDAGWWRAGRYLSTTLMLCVSELGEAMEGDRKNLMDDHLPEYKMLHVELADAVIRMLDCAGWLYPRLSVSDITAMQTDLLADPQIDRHAISAPARKCGIPAQLLICVTSLCDVLNDLPYDLRHNTQEAFAMCGVSAPGPIGRAYSGLFNIVRYCFGIAALQDVDLLPIINAKLAYNAKRADHKLENRAAVNGKKY